MDNIIEIKNIDFSYREEENAPLIKLFENFSLNIERGSFTAIIGHNGSGKSTLSRLMNGMYLPDSGEVFCEGISTLEEDRRFDIRQNVGLVFQNPDNQIVTTVVFEDVAFGPENLGIPPEEIKQRVETALKDVGMWECREDSTTKLSGGQKQRVAIAGILAMEPKCIVLDEPTAMLDPKGRKEVLSAVKRLNKEKGITVVLITHYMEEVTDADRVVVMKSGEIILDGTPCEVFSKGDILRSADLTLPVTCDVKEMLNKEGFNIPDSVLTPEECTEYILKSFEG
ncbi:MAG: energy-coupling factor transporter ATPase [Clostridia bacterium]|nr:energy-coupling factor transporter ATPase [Clostridia bacterium]